MAEHCPSVSVQLTHASWALALEPQRLSLGTDIAYLDLVKQLLIYQYITQ